MLRDGFALLLVAVWLGVPVSARAAEPASDPEALPIALESSACEVLDQRELLKLLAIEFQTLKVQARAPIEHVRIACDESVARVTIDAAPSGKIVDLRATAASAWPRLLALSVSEIVIESRAHLPEPAPPPAPVPVASARPAGVARPVPEARKVCVFAGGTLRRALRSSTWLSGPELGLQVDAWRHFSIAADLRGELGSTGTDLGRVHWASFSGALLGLVGGRIGDVRLGLGPGVVVGYLRWSATVDDANATGHVVSGGWGGVELSARARYDFSRRVFVAAHLDSGVVTWPVAGLVDGQRRLVDAGGAWTSGGLAVGVLF